MGLYGASDKDGRFIGEMRRLFTFLFFFYLFVWADDLFVIVFVFTPYAYCFLALLFFLLLVLVFLRFFSSYAFSFHVEMMGFRCWMFFVFSSIG